MTELASHYSARRAVPRGTGRIGIIRAYFTLFGLLGAIGCAAVARRILSAYPASSPTSRGEDLVTLASTLFMTLAFLGIDHLLKYRRRTGAWLAATCFGVGIGYSLFGDGGSPASMAISGLGLALVVSIWRELD